MPGYPDWQAYPQWRGAAVLNAEVTGTAGQTTQVGTWPVTSWASLLVATNGVFTGCTIHLWSSDDPTFGNYIEQEKWVVSPACGLHALVPVMADYARIAIESQATAGADLVLVVKPSNIASGAVQYPVPANEAVNSAIALAAGASQTMWLPYISPGWAQYRFSPDASGTDVSWGVYTGDAAGNTVDILTGSVSSAAAVSGQVWLPARPCGWKVINFGTAAATVEMGLWAS